MTSRPTIVKICGLSTELMVRDAVDAGADRVGFVVVNSSPRHVGFATVERLLKHVPDGVEPWVVGCWSGSRSSPTVPDLDRFVRDLPERVVIQLHGKESEDDVSDFAQKVGPQRRLVKAIGVATAADILQADGFQEARGFLFDAKAPPGADREGGFGQASYDWSILQRYVGARPYVLSGGLTAENVGEAIGQSGATAVDVSSGVESAPGVKDPARVRAFIAAAKGGAG